MVFLGVIDEGNWIKLALMYLKLTWLYSIGVWTLYTRSDIKSIIPC